MDLGANFKGLYFAGYITVLANGILCEIVSRRSNQQ